MNEHTTLNGRQFDGLAVGAYGKAIVIDCIDFSSTSQVSRPKVYAGPP